MVIMNKSQLVKLLTSLNSDSKEPSEDLERLYQKQYEEISTALNCSFDDILKRADITVRATLYSSKETYEWKYICLNFYILELLNDELSKSESEVLSVQEVKNTKITLQTLLSHGILKNLQPNLPHHIKTQTSNKNDILYGYNILKCTVSGFCHCMKYPNLRMLILPHLLQGILVALFQIAHCPLKKPTSKNQTSFSMTEETYTTLLREQEIFKNVLDNLSRTIHPSIFIKETMVLFQASAPIWFKKSISNTLTKMMRSNGIQHIVSAMVDGCDNDITKTWKILDVLMKLILSCRKFTDFKENICKQVLNLLQLVKMNSEFLVFERLVVSCTKCMYSEDKEFCKVVFIDEMMKSLLRCASEDHKFHEDDDITDDIKQTVRLLHGCFVEDSVNYACLPLDLLTGFINVIFYFYHLTVKSRFESTNKELRELLIKYIKNCNTFEINKLLDSFLFGLPIKDVLGVRNDVIIEINEKIIVKNSPHSIIHTSADAMDTIYDLLDPKGKIILFGYLLECLVNKEKYFLSQNNKDLLKNEDLATNTVLERLLTIHRVLSQLSENKDVQQSLRDRPEDIIRYISNVLASDSADSELVFVVVMILDNLVSNTSKRAISKYKVLTESLSTIVRNTSENELKCLCNKIITVLNEENFQFSETKEVSEFEKALEDVYDPLLPTRGHGLLVLSKLIEKKDKQAMERKQYLLNLFQLHLKDEDSFIYLNAVQGLTSLADAFPDTVLEVLCEEYADFSKRDAQETRMKLGEALVRVVRLLGEMAPKYKAVLLNTFLSGTKDDDNLIRASSLSNLSEVCRILNYKLGTIVTEVLVCVHSVIATDTAVEARRAAVTVIRQLFVGLQTEMLTFLKEDILPIYRTLKEIYYNDKDEVMRLQAQLALEELNENMKNIVFPNQQLHFEKKVVMLD